MDVISRARNSGGAGDAAQTEDRNALDVGRQTHTIDETRVKRRRGDAGHRGHKDRAEFLRGDAGFVQSLTESLFTELEGVLDPRVIGLSKRGEVLVEIDGMDQVAALDLHAFIEAVKDVRIRQTMTPVVLQCLRQEFLLVVVLGEGARNASNPHRRGLLLSLKRSEG